MGLHFSFSILSSYFILPWLIFYLQLHSWNSWEFKLRAGHFCAQTIWPSSWPKLFSRMTSVRGSPLCSYGFSFSPLSTLTHRLINWKPRRFATRWTPCGTRRSLTVESPRKTCTAKHSGKCLGASVLFVSFLSENRRLLAKDLVSSRPLAGCLVHYLQSSSHVFFTWFPFFSPSTEPLSPSVLVAPHLSCPDNIPALKFKPPLPLCLAFHPLLLPPLKLQWQIEVSLNTTGSFNFIDLTLWRWQKLRIVSGCE